LLLLSTVISIKVLRLNLNAKDRQAFVVK